MTQRPVVIGLMVCEQVIIEENTQNVTLVNCFWRKKVGPFPAEKFPFVIFALLTDGLGEMVLELIIQKLDTMEEIYQRSLPCRFTNPLQEGRCIFRTRDFSFPLPGHYQVSLRVEKEVLAQRKLVIS